MKKVLSIVLILTMLVVGTFLLTGCGEEKIDNDGKIIEGNNNNNNNNNNNQETSPKKETSNLTTVEGWLSYWGLTKGDLEPANFTRLDKTAYNIDTGEIKEVGAYVNQKLTDEESRAWIEEVLSELTILSEEGKITNSLEGDKELTVDYIMERNMRIGSGTFTYKGKKATVLISVMPQSLDNADPDEAMPACSIRLEH